MNITGNAQLAIHPPWPALDRGFEANRFFKNRAAPGDQIIAGVRCARPVNRVGMGILRRIGHLDRRMCDLKLGEG